MLEFEDPSGKIRKFEFGVFDKEDSAYLLSKAQILEQFASEKLKDWAGDAAKAVLGGLIEKRGEIATETFKIVGNCLNFPIVVMTPPSPFSNDPAGAKQYVGAIYNISIDIVASANKLAEIFYEITIGQLGLPTPPSLELPPTYVPEP